MINKILLFSLFLLLPYPLLSKGTEGISPSLKYEYVLNPFTFDLDSNIEVNQNINEKGLVMIEGNLVKPVTASNIKITIKYKDNFDNWIPIWCKEFEANYAYNENLKALFELPEASFLKRKIKIELNSTTNINNWTSIIWNKNIVHYKFGDYTINSCDLDENQYTILFTPKKLQSLTYKPDGSVAGIKDRVNSTHISNKLNDIVLSVHGNGTLNNTASTRIDITNPANVNPILSSQKYIYQYSDVEPWQFSYRDPVYLFAGKFSASGFFITFSYWAQTAAWGGEEAGRGYLDFTNPNALLNRYFNLYNYIQEKLSEVMTDQEPVVIAISRSTGLRIYKSNGSFISLNAISNYGGTNSYGHPVLVENQNGTQIVTERGPGSESFSLKNTSNFSFYGMGAIKNHPKTGQPRPLADIESEINKFINYVGIFGENNPNYNSFANCSNKCITINSNAIPDYTPTDWTKAPNSYIFDPTDPNHGDGLYIPVKKAYAMWEKDKLIGGANIPAGAITADVLWEDNHGLIKSGTNYALEIIGSGENAKIKIPINKSKEGNAVIAYKVNGTIYWSWHVWVTDNPTNGSNYKSFPNVSREKPDGTIEIIPDAEWKWMDRNLGAVASTLTEAQWIKSGGLLYQWGRKDPIPSLVYKGNDFYEVSGSIGRVRHRQARNMVNATSIDNLTKKILLSNANVINNIKLSVNNPLGLIYVNKDDNSGPAYYNNNLNLMMNWFGTSSTLSADKLSELNLWSDNSKGKIVSNYNNDTSAAPYRNKSPYDPCPNGWRIPSMLTANLASNSYVDDIRIDFSPFGARTNMGMNLFKANNYHIVKPNDNNTPTFLKGIKLYTNLGMDFSNVAGHNMGIYPGTGTISRIHHDGQFTDHHHTVLWTATMPKHFDASPVVNARTFGLIPDLIQPDVPDPNLPNITGRYFHFPVTESFTSDANACRCIKDPLYSIALYDFPTEFFTDNSNYTEGLYQPNSYQRVKDASKFTIEIPVNKAFSAQSQLLNNPGILNSSNFNNLKTNVLWTTNTNLIGKVSVLNPSPGSLSDLNNSKILVEINPNQSGNSVVTLHNGSITNPVYWSWHIWITDTPVGYNTYTTVIPESTASNYVNYSKSGLVTRSDIMDRDLGANQVLINTNRTLATAGLHYQWGRKDPLPVFVNVNRNPIPVYLGTVQENGSLTYIPLSGSIYYSDTYTKKYNDYATLSNVLTTDKPADKIGKVLSYSVKNPLIFMAPSTLTTKASNPNNTNGSDWLSPNTEPNLAPDRWGRGVGKSPFDPCPEGWRIPDVSTAENPTKGSSVFYKPTTGSSITSNYMGGMFLRVPNNTRYVIGYEFNNALYNIGSFANSGVRGYRYTIEALPENPDFYGSNIKDGGFWLAALNSNYTGRALRVAIDYQYHTLVTTSSNSDPYFAQSCRCVKIKSDENGLEQGIFPKLQIASITGRPANNIYSKSEINNLIEKENGLKVFPNPVENNLYIESNGTKVHYYQLYNFAGQMIMKGKFIDRKIDLSHLTSGVYLIRIDDSNEIFKIIKK